MEDYSRDLEKELTRYSVPNPFRQSRNWQLLFISDDGRTVSINRYKGLVTGVIAALIVAVVIAATVSVLYGKSRAEKNRLKEMLDRKTVELQNEIKEKELLNARLFLLKRDEIKVEVKDESIKKTGTKPEKKPAPEKKETMKAGINDLSFSKIEGSPTTRIRFQIRNTGVIKRISGYVFVIIKPDLESQQGWLTLPSVPLVDGVPEVCSKGRYFSINNFKTMYFNYNDKNLVQIYNNITVFIFSKEGEKVFEATYPVEVKTIKKKEKPARKEKELAKKETVKKETAKRKPEAEKNIAPEKEKTVKQPEKAVEKAKTDAAKSESTEDSSAAGTGMASEATSGNRILTGQEL